MPVRHATLRYPDPISFARDWESSLKSNALVLSAEVLGGEPAPEMRVDLVLPDRRRVGPVFVQLVSRFADGGAAFIILEMPPQVPQAAADVYRTIERVKEYLLTSGKLCLPVPALDAELLATRGRVMELEMMLARARRGQGDDPTPEPVGRRDTRATGPSKLDLRRLDRPEFTGGTPRFSGPVAAIANDLMEVSVKGLTGILRVDLPEKAVRWGFWEDGKLLAWRSEPVRPEETLGVLLHRAGSLSREQLEESVARMAERGCRQGEALIEMGVLTYPQLMVLLQRQAELVLKGILNDPHATYAFHVVASLPERFETAPVSAASTLFRHHYDHLRQRNATELAAEVKAMAHQYAAVRPGTERAISELRLRPGERKFIRFVQSATFRVGEICIASPLSRADTFAVLLALKHLAILEFGEQAGSRAGPVHARATAVAARKGVVDRGTLFDRLDLHWVCDTSDVEAAWRRLGAERPGSEAGASDSRNAQDLPRAQIEEAYNTLRGDVERRAYRNRVIGREIVENGARLLSQKAELALLKGDYALAYECYARAVELVPTNSQAQMGLTMVSIFPNVRNQR